MLNLLNISICIEYLYSLDEVLHYTQNPLFSVLPMFFMESPFVWLIHCFTFQYQSTRPFFIQVEMPTDSVKGEQLGIRIALFNYWNTALEVRYTP